MHCLAFLKVNRLTPLFMLVKAGVTKYSSVAVSLHVRIYGSDLSV